MNELINTRNILKLKEIRKVLEYLAEVLAKEDELSDSQLMEISSVYPEYKVGYKYSPKEIFKYGTNSDGEPQLYMAKQEYVSTSEFPPDMEGMENFYRRIGMSDSGYLEWTQPYTFDDAYDIGDIRMFNDKLYICEQGNAFKDEVARNTFPPDQWGWKLYEEK